MAGEAGHAGTVPMGLRKDALAAAAEMILAVERRAHGATESGLVATVGAIEASPGAPNVVPGKVDVHPRHPCAARCRPAQGDRGPGRRIRHPGRHGAMSGSRSRSSTTSRPSPAIPASSAALEAAVPARRHNAAPAAQRRRARRARDRRPVPDRHAVRALQGRHQPQPGRVDHHQGRRRGDARPARLPAPFPWSRRCPTHGRCGCVIRWRSWPRATPRAASSWPAGGSSSWCRRAARRRHADAAAVRRLGACRAARA